MKPVKIYHSGLEIKLTPCMDAFFRIEMSHQKLMRKRHKFAFEWVMSDLERTSGKDIQPMTQKAKSDLKLIEYLYKEDPVPSAEEWLKETNNDLYELFYHHELVDQVVYLLNEFSQITE